jgi:hypothetical protein
LFLILALCIADIGARGFSATHACVKDDRPCRICIARSTNAPPDFQDRVKIVKPREHASVLRNAATGRAISIKQLVHRNISPKRRRQRPQAISGPAAGYTTKSMNNP